MNSKTHYTKMLTAFIIDLHINIIICLSIQLTKVNLFASPNFKNFIVHLCTLFDNININIVDKDINDECTTLN